MKSFWNSISSKGLTFKLILFIFAGIAIIFFLIFMYNYRVSRKIVYKNLVTNAEYLTSSTVLSVEKVLSSVQKIPQNYARTIESSEFSEKEIIPVLHRLLENNPEIFGTTLALEPFLFSPEKKYFAPYFYRGSDSIVFKFIGDDQYDYFSMDWYQVPKELNRPMWSEPYFDEGAGNVLMSTYSVPIYYIRNGKKCFAGILTADISLDWLQDYMNSIRIFRTGYGFMISSNGTIVTHPDRELIMNETIFSIADAQKSPMLRQIGKNMIRGEKSFAEFEYHNIQTGKLSWIAYAPVPLNNWSVGLVLPVDEFLSDVNSLSLKLLIFCLAGLFLILLMIVFISGSITKPLRTLTGAAVHFARGDFNFRLPEIRSKDEIGKLNESFITMQNALASTIRELKDASAKLKISNEKLEDYNLTLEQKVADRTSELNEANLELNAAFNNVRILNQIGKKLTSTLMMEHIQEMVYENVNSLMDATTLLIMLYNQDERKLECKLSMEKGEKLPLFEISLDEKDRFAVWCVDHASPVFMNDVDNEYKKYVAHRARPKAGETVSSLIYLPLMIENRIMGVISVQSFKKDAYSQYQLDMLNNLANYIAIAIENSLTYEKINKANNDLKAAQAQLIQSEKMASLGQMTAGIAHEIKNPLNFINNFSELVVEMVDELDVELEKISSRLSPGEAEMIRGITGDIITNSKLINEHGRRADNIVKNMLFHSGGKPGDKQLTHINSLLAESLNLSYSSMRAKDSNFNLKIETLYDPETGTVNVVPQNISRVFLNIISNACYSTIQKRRMQKNTYNPVLQIRTVNFPDNVEIHIRDNGMGIPSRILDKIFNPFFTTKPAGQGTGLGLSLSYDIVVHEHQGKLQVESAEGEFAEFIITLPKT